ncbi:unnamed protein product [Amoebophrya sp. A120]|nr:unnamed protein product [Amoebophrya sp. A120]|eukprot:GSA120T00001245001.1
MDAPYRPPASEVRSVFLASHGAADQSPGFGYSAGGGSSSSSPMKAPQFSSAGSRTAPSGLASNTTNPLLAMNNGGSLSGSGSLPPAALGMNVGLDAQFGGSAGSGGGGGGGFGGGGFGPGGYLNNSLTSTSGNKTPKQVVHNYLSGADPRQFSPVPLPRIGQDGGGPQSTTDLAFLRNSLEQETKRVAVINERLGFLEDQNRTFRELCWDKIAHLEKESLNLKEQVLDKMMSMEQAQRINLQEHAMQVTALSQKVDDFASDESTQERVQRALLKELDELKIVENIQNMSGSLKASVAKMEDRIRHTGEHAEQMLQQNLKNAKADIDSLIDMKLKEFVVAHLVPIQKEISGFSNQQAMKNKEVEFSLQTLDSTVDRNRNETVEALAETRRSTVDSIRQLEKEAQVAREQLQEKHTALEISHGQRLTKVTNDAEDIREKLVPTEVNKLKEEFIENFDKYQKQFESKMFNLLAVREKEEAAALPAQNQAAIAQLTQTVFQNAEVLEQVKFQVLENVKNFGSMRQEFGSGIMASKQDLDLVRGGLEKVKKWACELDNQLRDFEQQKGFLMNNAGGGAVATETLSKRIEQLERDTERRFEASERRHAETLINVTRSRPSSPQRSSMNNNFRNSGNNQMPSSSSRSRSAANQQAIRKSISSTLAQSIESVISNGTASNFADPAQQMLNSSLNTGSIEKSLPISKAEFSKILKQLEQELRAVAEATEIELDVLRNEVFEHVEDKSGITLNQVEDSLRAFEQTVATNAALMNNNSRPAIADIDPAIPTKLSVLDRKCDDITSRVDRELHDMKRDLGSQAQQFSRDLDLTEARAREANLDLQLKQERLEKMILQERSSAGAISAAYAAAERRGRAGI